MCIFNLFGYIKIRDIKILIHFFIYRLLKLFYNFCTHLFFSLKHRKNPAPYRPKYHSNHLACLDSLAAVGLILLKVVSKCFCAFYVASLGHQKCMHFERIGRVGIILFHLRSHVINLNSIASIYLLLSRLAFNL